MNLRLWIRLSINQCLQSFFYLGFLLVLLHFAQPDLDFSFLYKGTLWKVPYIFWLFAIVVSVSLIYTLYITLALNSTYEQIRAKINWLLLGKYHHPIFSQEVRSRSWYDNDYILCNDINRLRQQLLQMSEDLQEFTAAPVFVGEDTKEEIIESERARIARELHDSVSQELFAATMMLSALTETRSQDLPPAFAKNLEKIEQVIGSAQTEMRALLLHLRPVDLQGKSLKQGIQNLLQELQAKIPLQLTWELDDPRLESGIEDHLFRIVQEAVSNTMRHARAKKLDVYLRETVDMISIRIVDDGIGFDTQNNQKVGSYGLNNIQDRVKGMGGTSKVISAPGQGTVIDIKIPYKPVHIPQSAH